MRWLPVILLGAWMLLLVCWTRGLIIQIAVNIYRKLDHMAAVQIDQEDLDSVANSLDALVDAVTSIDTSKLPAADQTALQEALTDLTAAVNDKLPVSVSDGDGAV